MLLEEYYLLASRMPDECPHLFGRKINGAKGLWLSMDVSRHPHLLFETKVDDNQPDLKLKSVEVRFSCPCNIQLQDGNMLSGLYTLVSLGNDDIDLIRVFLRLLDEAFLVPDADHSPKAIREKILSIADLFTRIDIDIKDILGLWGELFIINNSRNLLNAVQSWSSSPHAKYDFVTDSFVLEVKSTLKSSRTHRFLLEQLRPTEDTQVFVASVLLIENSGGVSVAELMDQVYNSLDDQKERTRFFRLCLQRGGVDIYGSELRLRPLPDNSSVILFNSLNLPVPSIEMNDPITNVRFDLDLTTLQPLPDDFSESILSFCHV